MTRTIQQIYGETGIQANGTDDIFEETETKTKESLIKSLQGLRSIDEEAQMAKGFQGNTFLDGARMQQEQGIISSVETQLAGARLQDNLNQKNMERGIVTSAYNADLQKDFTTHQADIQKDMMEIQQDNTKELMQEQTTLDKEKMGYSNELQQDNMTLQQTIQKDINTQLQNFQQANATQSFGFQKELLGDQFDNQIATLQKQFNLGEQGADSALNRNIRTIQTQTAAQIEVVNKQFTNGEISAARAQIDQIALVGLQYDKSKEAAIAQLKAQAKLSTGIDPDSPNYPGELKMKYDNELKLLSEKMEIEKNNAEAQVRYTLYVNSLVSTLSQMDGWIGGFGDSLLSMSTGKSTGGTDPQ
jgi:hypothetical protein